MERSVGEVAERKNGKRVGIRSLNSFLPIKQRPSNAAQHIVEFRLYCNGRFKRIGAQLRAPMRDEAVSQISSRTLCSSECRICCNSVCQSRSERNKNTGIRSSRGYNTRSGNNNRDHMRSCKDPPRIRPEKLRSGLRRRAKASALACGASIRISFSSDNALSLRHHREPAPPPPKLPPPPLNPLNPPPPDELPPPPPIGKYIGPPRRDE
jgi:hypothetical protein